MLRVIQATGPSVSPPDQRPAEACLPVGLRLMAVALHPMVAGCLWMWVVQHQPQVTLSVKAGKQTQVP